MTLQHVKCTVKCLCDESPQIPKIPIPLDEQRPVCLYQDFLLFPNTTHGTASPDCRPTAVRGGASPGSVWGGSPSWQSHELVVSGSSSSGTSAPQKNGTDGTETTLPRGWSILMTAEESGRLSNSGGDIFKGYKYMSWTCTKQRRQSSQKYTCRNKHNVNHSVNHWKQITKHMRKEKHHMQKNAIGNLV